VVGRKLPVTAIFFEALSFPGKYHRELLRVGFPLIIFGAILSIYGNFSGSNFESFDITIIKVVIYILFITSLVIAIVECHRIFIIGPEIVSNSNLLNWTGNELRYAGWWLIIGIYAVIIFIPLMILVIPITSSSLGESSDNNPVFYFLFGLINIPFYYLISRWSLVLPSCAIGKHGKSMSWSWGLSAGNSWRLTLLISGVPFVVDSVSDLLPFSESLIYSLVLGGLWLVVGVVEIALLSLSYAYLIKFRDEAESVEENCANKTN
jgi:hypothetical protein